MDICGLLLKNVGLHDRDMVFSQLLKHVSQRGFSQVQRPQIQTKHHVGELIGISRGIERKCGSVVLGDELAEVIHELLACEGSLGIYRG